MKQKTEVGKITRSYEGSLRSLTPDALSRILDQFRRGYFGEAAKVWDIMERRDDVLQGLTLKRKKSVSRLKWSILTKDDSAEAFEQQEALEYFYNNVIATHAYESHQRGGLRLLIEQMMDAIGKCYAVHEMVYEVVKEAGHERLRATLRFVPLWHFRNKDGRLTFHASSYEADGIELDRNGWMVTTGDGLMEASSIAYLFKHLPLRNWLVYCERNGMPAIKAITDAIPDTPEWNSAKEAIRGFGSEYNTLLTRGTDIQTIDLTTKGVLPYPELVDRMDRALTALWRGCDLSTLSGKDSVGASLQQQETLLLEQDDAERITETLQQYIDAPVLSYLFPNRTPLAYFKLIPPTNDVERDLALFRELHSLGVTFPKSFLANHFNLPLEE